MKYSLFKENPIWYLDIYAESILEKGRIRLKPLDGQSADSSLRIECSRKLRKKYGVGTVFKLDVRLVKPQNKIPYLYRSPLDEGFFCGISLFYENFCYFYKAVTSILAL